MNHITSFVKRQALPLFCALTIALNFAAALLPVPGEAVPVVMVFIPALVALGLAALTDGCGVRALLSKRGQWRLRPLWVVVAVVLGLVLRLSMSVIALLLTSVFHAAQSFFVIVNDGITLEQQIWLMAGVFVTIALVIALIAGPR